jgi:hypothetical protein
MKFALPVAYKQWIQTSFFIDFLLMSKVFIFIDIR